MKKVAFPLFVSFSFIFSVVQHPQKHYEDDLRTKEAINISNLLGDKIWKGFNEVQFAILLVADSIELLLNHPKPSKDFIDAGRASILHAYIDHRKTKFSKNFLDSFSPISSLDLSGGDQTAMWMLNYSFPFSDSFINEQFYKYKLALKEAVNAVKKRKLRAAFNIYYAERDEFKSLLGAEDYSYFTFQIWQEGIARYTKHKILMLLKNYTTSTEVQKLNDYISFKELEAQFHEGEFGFLNKSTLKNKSGFPFIRWVSLAACC